MVHPGQTNWKTDMAIDTLGYAQRLREAGVDQKQAEAHATAVRDFIMTEIATKADLSRLEGELKSQLRSETGRLEGLIERQTLMLTIRLGGLMIAGIGALALLARLGQ